MRIALLHYHLNPGGVTTVMGRQAALLTEAQHEVLLIAGASPPGASLPAPVAVVPGLAYDRAGQAAPSTAQTVTDLENALRRHWPDGPPDLIHAHNPILAKNKRLPNILHRLQRNGHRLLCQVHDFAEDGRPEAYCQEPYPADCHYAVLNGRDRHLLQAAGLSDAGVHYLPNAIDPIALPAEMPGGSAGPVLYPVRAIRRKNIGEAILLRLFMQTAAPLAITLPPQSGGDMDGYRLWRKTVADQGLPVMFEAGCRADFRRLLAQCRFALTTSITEGFGFAFLEPWCAGKALWGRLLPDICDDFSRKGIALGHLYRQLRVPLDWLDAPMLQQQWCNAWLAAAECYELTTDVDIARQGWATIGADGWIDFGLLNEPHQQTILARMIADPRAKRLLADHNPFLRAPGPPLPAAALIDGNRRAVLRHFHPAGHLQRLLAIYHQVMAHPVRQAIDKRKLAAAFLTPERFSLLKWRPFHG